MHDVRYFECTANHGIFIAPGKITPLNTSSAKYAERDIGAIVLQ